MNEARGRLLDSAFGRLAGLASKAAETLQRLMESDQPSVALGTAKAVLELGRRLRESTKLEERISRLEDKADEMTNVSAGAQCALGRPIDAAVLSTFSLA